MQGGPVSNILDPGPAFAAIVSAICELEKNGSLRPLARPVLGNPIANDVTHGAPPIPEAAARGREMLLAPDRGSL